MVRRTRWAAVSGTPSGGSEGGVHAVSPRPANKPGHSATPPAPPGCITFTSAISGACPKPKPASARTAANRSSNGTSSPSPTTAWSRAVALSAGRGLRGVGPPETAPSEVRETQRALAGVDGKCRILPGIDIGISTGKNSRKASPEDTYATVAAALKAGADGVILSRK